MDSLLVSSEKMICYRKGSELSKYFSPTQRSENLNETSSSISAPYPNPNKLTGLSCWPGLSTVGLEFGEEKPPALLIFWQAAEKSIGRSSFLNSAFLLFKISFSMLRFVVHVLTSTTQRCGQSWDTLKSSSGLSYTASRQEISSS